MEGFIFAFFLLIGPIDKSLSFSDRNLIKEELSISDDILFEIFPTF